MKVLVVHNYYQQPGGEEQIFNTEATLLQSYGHEVLRYTLSNDQIRETNPLVLAKRTLWNSNVYQELRTLVRQEKPNIAHFHNTFPLISPAAHYALKEEGVPVVQTLHNYRLLCPNALFFRSGKVCEDCLGKRFALYPWQVERELTRKNDYAITKNIAIRFRARWASCYLSLPLDKILAA